jgi:DUF3102 family protein
MSSIPEPAPEFKLAEHADAIRALGKQTVANIIEIGCRLTDAKNIAGHGNWLPWLDREFGWKEQTARNFMRAYELSLKSPKFADLALPLSGLYLLAAPSTPPEARDEIIERAEAGEALPVAEVKRVVEKHKDHARGRKQPAKKKRKKHRHRFYIDTKDGGRLYEDDARAHLEQMRKQDAIDSARVAKILIDRVGVEVLTLVYAAMFLKRGYVFLDELINVPGTYGAEVCAKVNEDSYTPADFYAKYGNGELLPADDGHDIPECSRRSAQ